MRTTWSKRGGVTFSILAPDRPPALADPDGLRQIFANLFDNALRYTSPGGRITVRIVTSVEPEASPVDQSAPPTNTVGAPGGGAEERAWIVVEVKDTGSGIPQAALPRIFERFYRVDPARSRAEGGTGLGLSIVKHLVEGMGGDVTAASELGKGTTIRLRLSPAPVPAGSARSGADEGAGRVRAE